MSRASAASTQQAIGTNTAAEQQAAQNAQSAYSTEMPLYENMLNTGFTPEEKSSMMTEGMGATASPFSTASKMAENEAAKTRNSAALPGQEDQLAQAKGEAMGGEAGGLQTEFANEVLANRNAGLQGINNLYNSQVGLESGTLSNAAPLENAYTQATVSPWASILQSAMGAAGEGIGAAYGGKCWIAAACYGGWEAPQVSIIRRFIFEEWNTPVGRFIADLYLRFGERVANHVKKSKILKALFRFLFDKILAKGNSNGAG